MLLRNMSNSHRMGGKLDPVFTGPYTVAEILDKGRYSLLNADGKKLKKLYNGVLLKEYVEPSELGDKHSQKVPPIKQSKVTKRPKRTKPISHGPPKKRKVCLYKLTIILICIILFTLQNTFWVPSLSLTLYDKDVIESTEGLLCDKHMLAANEIFANQFPSLQGLQSTLLCQSDGFVPISVDGGSGYITEGKLPYTLLSPPRC